jgi:hypothetical protein
MSQMNLTTRLRSWAMAGAIAIGLLGSGAMPAAATAFLFDTNTASSSLGTGPWGSALLTQNGTTVDFTIHLFGTNAFVKTGAGDDMAFKFNATGITLADITIDAHVPGLTAKQAATTGGFNGDGGGAFNYGITCASCGGGSSDKFSTDIMFHVANAVIADFTTVNNKGYIFAIDILANGNTGLAETSGPCTPGTAGCPRDIIVQTPEPASIALLGVGLLGLGLVTQRRRIF